MKQACLVTLFLPIFSFAQDTVSLPAITLTAFEKEQQLKKIPAAISLIQPGTLNRSNNISLAAAINTSPGVRLEERSPGSYRVNIRASSLRSPFGVRNTKVYLDDLPFSEPGGHTYFNQLGFYNISSLTIIRGPGSSIYGAGTGGVMLIKTKADLQPGFNFNYTTGSFANHYLHLRAITKERSSTHLTSYQHHENNGYRDHSEMKRQVFNYSGRFFSGNKQVQATFLYGNLGYETPGALTLAGYNADPRASRPATPVFPSAKDANASVKQQMLFGGISVSSPLGKKFENRTGIYGMFTTLRNPNIQGYDAVDEPHNGLRSVFTYKDNVFEINSGIEYQAGRPKISAYTNRAGKRGELRWTDQAENRRFMVFVQASLSWKDWVFSLSSSFNSLEIASDRTKGPGPSLPKTKFTDLAPRFSLLKDLGKFSIYAGYSRGFSPPTSQEILPSGGEINPNLEAEQGNNFEIGSRGSLNRFTWDMNFFSYHLRKSIVQRRTAGGGDYYINAGSTRQDGLELLFEYDINNKFLSRGSRIRFAYTYNDFRYKEFVMIGEDHSGNKMPSVPVHQFNLGASFSRGPFILTLTNEYIGSIPLNDANDAFSKSANIIGSRLEWISEGKLKPILFVAAYNLFNETYSLGNDFNGFGGRYYNAAPGRNYAAGIGFNLPWQ